MVHVNIGVNNKHRHRTNRSRKRQQQFIFTMHDQRPCLLHPARSSHLCLCSLLWAVDAGNNKKKKTPAATGEPCLPPVWGLRHRAGLWRRERRDETRGEGVPRKTKTVHVCSTPPAVRLYVVRFFSFTQRRRKQWINGEDTTEQTFSNVCRLLASFFSSVLRQPDLYHDVLMF